MKAQSFQVCTLKNQIAACLRLIALHVKSAILKLVDLETKLKEVMSEQINEISRIEAANRIKQHLESIKDDHSYVVNIWEKEGRVRCYIKDMSYKSSKAQDQGYLIIEWDGEINFGGIKNNSWCVNFIKESARCFKIIADEIAKNLIRQSKTAYKPKQSFRDYVEAMPSSNFNYSGKDWCYGAVDEESF